MEPVSLEDAIAQSEAAQANKLNDHEVNQIAESVRWFLRSKEESVESLFDPEDDTGVMVVNLDSI